MNQGKKGIVKGEGGFTLIELLAVMAILGILVAIVAPSISGSKDASIAAQTMQDATQVRSAASKYFSNDNNAEVITPHTVSLTATVNDTAVTSTVQAISTKWPEKFITTGNTTYFSALYANVFATSASSTTGQVVNVNLKDKDGNNLNGITFLAGFTAIDMVTLEDMNLLEKAPASADMDVPTGITGVSAPSFLWLFDKTDSASGRTNDNREVAVFRLIKVEKNEGTVNNSATTVDLSYERIF